MRVQKGGVMTMFFGILFGLFVVAIILEGMIGDDFVE